MRIIANALVYNIYVVYCLLVNYCRLVVYWRKSKEYFVWEMIVVQKNRKFRFSTIVLSKMEITENNDSCKKCNSHLMS